MPKFDPRQVQKELDSGRLWPVYWLHGPERMKVRELVKRIRKAVLGEDGANAFNEDSIDGADATGALVVDAARSMALGGGAKLVIVREAHLMKDAEPVAELFGPAVPREELTSVCVFLAKDLDGRKKFSKLLADKAAVVACDDATEEERESWIGYLAKRRGMTLEPGTAARLRSMDPWTLDIVEQELEKLDLSGGDAEILLGGSSAQGGTDEFFEAFFGRRLRPALEVSAAFADSPDESLPLLGLLAWNVRHLALVVNDRERGTRHAKLGSFVADRLNRWSRGWSLDEMLELQRKLAELDFGIKQTHRLPLGLWTGLVTTFCRA